MIFHSFTKNSLCALHCIELCAYLTLIIIILMHFGENEAVCIATY